MRFLFTTLGHVESDFYGRVGVHLAERGHEVGHLTYSRRAASVLRRRGFAAWCLPDLMAEVEVTDPHAEAERIAREYPIATFRDIYRADFVCDGKPEAWCVERTVRHVLAIERLVERWRPSVIVPEVGNETIREASHLVGLRRDIPVLFLFYTIFPDPLRLYVDSLEGPVVDRRDLRALTADEAAQLDDFVRAFTRRRLPIRNPRDAHLTRHRVRMILRHFTVKAAWDRDNPYLRPIRWLTARAGERVRRRLARRWYSDLPAARRFVYFPLHVPDDYKIKRVIPHLADQGAIIEQVARALPHGIDVVVKEHPMSIGRTPLRLLRRLARLRNVHVMAPERSSHDLIELAEAIVVISSTVGFEALLYNKPVLTIGRPFYSGLGATLDANGTEDLVSLVPAVLDFEPDPELVRRVLHAAMRACRPGAPVLVDRSDANARALAGSIEDGAAGALEARRAGTDRPTAQARALRAVPGTRGR